MFSLQKRLAMLKLVLGFVSKWKDVTFVAFRARFGEGSEPALVYDAAVSRGAGCG